MKRQISLSTQKLFLFCLFALCLGIISCSKDDDTVEPDPDVCDVLDVHFAADIMPIIAATCAIPDCHVAGFANGDYTTYDGIKQKVDGGFFETRVTDKTMPPPDTAGPASLTDAEIEKIQCWLDDGAPNN